MPAKKTKRQDFYKGAKGIFDGWDSEVEKAYLEGQHLFKDKYGSKIKEPLSKGTTKYNIALMERCRNMISSYTYLIVMENMLISVVSEYSYDKIRGITRNIWHIMSAQKGTTDYLRLLRRALSRYQLKHQNIYDAIKKNLDSVEERMNRNAAFLSEFANECGLGKVADAIKDEYGMTMYEHTAKVIEEYNDSHPREIGEDDEVFYARRNANYVEIIRDIATQNNIDLTECVMDAVETDKQRVKAIREKIKQEKNDRRDAERQTTANAAITADNIAMFHALENGNTGSDMSDQAYKNLLHKLTLFRGHGCYIAIVKSRAVYYYAEPDGHLTKTMATAGIYPNETCDSILSGIKHAHEKYPDANVTIQKISMPENLVHDAANNSDIDKNIIDYQKKVIMNILTDSSQMSTSNMMMLEKVLLENDRKIIYVMGIMNDNGYYMRNMKNKKKNYSMFLSDCVFYHDEEEAGQAVERYENDVSEGRLPADFRFHIVTLEYNGKLMSHGKCTDEIAAYMDGFVKYLSNPSDPYTNMLLYFDNATGKNRMDKVLADNGSIYMIMRKSMSITSNRITHISAVGFPDDARISTILSKISMDELTKKIRATSTVRTDIYGTTDEELSQLKELSRRIAKTLPYAVIEIINLSHENGTYSWEFVDRKF